MDNCYVVLRHCQNVDDPSQYVTTLAKVTETLGLAEYYVYNEFRKKFKEVGEVSVACELWPGCTNARDYYEAHQYRDGMATEYFTVSEEPIENNMALI